MSVRTAGPLRTLLGDDLRRTLLTAVPSVSGTAPSASRHFQLVPSGGLRFVSDDTFRLQCLLHAVLVDQGKEVWRARYVVNTEATYSSKSAEDGKRAAERLNGCLRQAHGLFQMHKTGSLGPLKGYDIRAGHPYGGPVVERLLPDRVVLVEPIGLYEIWKGDVTKMEPL